MSRLPDTIRPDLWTVERGGTATGYLPGWFAFSPDRLGEAAWFPGYPEAVAYADSRSRGSRAEQELEDALAQWGMLSEIVHPAIATNAPNPARFEIVALYQLGISIAEIGRRLKCSKGTVQKWVNRHRQNTTEGI